LFIYLLPILFWSAPKLSSTEAYTITLGDGIQFDVYLVDISQTEIKMYRNVGNGKTIHTITEVHNFAKTKGENLIFATNGGMYRPDLTPEGLYVENGKTFYPLNLEKRGRLEFMNFYNIPPNGVFYITKDNQANVVTSLEYLEIVKQQPIKYATQSGPLLFNNGVRNPHFKASSTSKFVRTGVGITKQGKVMFAISHKPLNFFNFSRIFDFYGCQDALYLDGAISEMYLPELGRLQTAQYYSSIIAVTHKK
ncbi:MAG: phosphodiester glycosidase family protein, partial [Bacteroidota bacterium]